MTSVFLKSEFSRRVAILVTGTALAQAIPVIVSPLLTRLYSPTEFGVFGTYVALVSILGVAAGGRYEMAVVLPERDAEARTVVVIGGVVSVIVGLILLAIVVSFHEKMRGLSAIAQIGSWIYLLPLSVVLMGAYQSLSYWLVRKKAFRDVALSRLGQTGCMAIPQLGFGLLGTTGGLIIGHVLGWIAGNLVAAWRGKGLDFGMGDVRAPDICELATRYSEFPKYNALPSVLDAASQSIPVIMVTGLFGGAAGGFLAMSKQLLSAPLALVSAAVSQVLLQKLAEDRNARRPLRGSILGLAYRLSAIAAPVALFIIAFGPDVFAMIFGEGWRTAGEISQVMAVPFALRFVVSPLSVVFPALGAIGLGSVWQVLYFVAIASLGMAGVTGFRGFMVAYALVETAVYMVYFAMIFKVVHDRDAQLVDDVP